MSNPTVAGGQPPAPPAAQPAPLALAPAAPPAVDVAAIQADARKAERERIAGINAATIPGHEALAQAAIESGQTPEQFALAQSLAERNRGASATEQRRLAIAAQPQTPPVLPAAPPPASALPETDEAAGAKWEADPTLRAEFAVKADYVALARAQRDGKVAFLRDRRAA